MPPCTYTIHLQEITAAGTPLGEAPVSGEVQSQQGARQIQVAAGTVSQQQQVYEVTQEVWEQAQLQTETRIVANAPYLAQAQAQRRRQQLIQQQQQEQLRKQQQEQLRQQQQQQQQSQQRIQLHQQLLLPQQQQQIRLQPRQQQQRIQLQSTARQQQVVQQPQAGSRLEAGEVLRLDPSNILMGQGGTVVGQGGATGQIVLGSSSHGEQVFVLSFSACLSSVSISC